MKNLVIVESPAKAKTIEKFLGKDYTVMSSYGHIRDLAKKEMSIDVDNEYEPEYQISEEKAKLEAEEKALKAHLKTRLPKYMLPDLWMRLSALPKTGSGKTDRLQVKRMYDDEHTVL